MKVSPISKTLSTVGVKSGTLTFDYMTKKLDANEFLYLDYSIDGGNTFTRLGSFNATQWTSEEISLPEDALGISNLMIKFTNVANEKKERTYIDNIKLDIES